MGEKWDETFNNVVCVVATLIFGDEGKSSLIQNIISEALRNKGLYEYLKESYEK